MYKVKETFEYIIENKDNFTSVEDALKICNSFTGYAWKDCPLPVSTSKECPWGVNSLEITKMNNKMTINRDTLLNLIKRNEQLDILEEYGVNNWESYSEAINALNEEIQDDGITDENRLEAYT